MIVRLWMVVQIVAVLDIASAEAHTERGGSLSVGTTAFTVADVAVALSQPGSFAAGWHHSLVVLRDGTAWGWGRNNHCQLGDGTTESRPTPAPVDVTCEEALAAAGSPYAPVRWRPPGRRSGSVRTRRTMALPF